MCRHVSAYIPQGQGVTHSPSLRFFGALAPGRPKENPRPMPAARLTEGFQNFAPVRAVREWRDGLRLLRDADRLTKAAQAQYEDIDGITAAHQDAVISPALAVVGAYGDLTGQAGRGIPDKTGATFETLRRWADVCPPARAILGVLIEEAAAAADIADQTRYGRATKLGWRIRMTNTREKPGAEDLKQIDLWQRFFAEGGFCAPPEGERPAGWQPGLEYVIRCLTEDSYVLDHAPLRLWRSATDPGKYPVVAFAPLDGALVRTAADVPVGVDRGRIAFETFPNERETRFGQGRKIRYVRLSEEGGRPVEQYTDAECAVFCRHPRTTRKLNGYGVSETETAINVITSICFAAEYNQSRFRTDALPRGMLVLRSNVDQQQLSRFRMEWQQLLKGLTNRWNIPILQVSPQVTGGAAGQDIMWVPMDPQSRDIEYSQGTYTWIAWLHSLYRIHPEQTGFAATNPFRPPLSEASPETRLKHSQEHSLGPYLRALARFLNREVLWRNVPDRRYSLEFVGLGDDDAMADEELVEIMLANGTVTPRMIWEARDLPIPAILADSDAWDLPMPLAQGLAYLDGLRQQQMAEEQAEREQAMQDEAMAAAAPSGGAPGMPGQGVPPGMSGAPAGPAGPAGAAIGAPEGMEDAWGAPGPAATDGDGTDAAAGPAAGMLPAPVRPTAAAAVARKSALRKSAVIRLRAAGRAERSGGGRHHFI